MKAPFPYFGSKATIAATVWQALGQPKYYIEAFFGSGAVLLARPDYVQGKYIETVCDKDGFIANVWRALIFNPDEVAKWCDWPVNHADLCARRKELIKNEERLLKNLIASPEWYDAKLAGFWIWSSSCWIGSGLTSPGSRPHISHGGTGVHGLGQIPHISHGGTGVHGLGQIPHISHAGKGVHGLGKRPLYDWFTELSNRLRYVRVVCGDWTRVCGGDWQDKCGTVGIFFDPPYGVTDRDTTIYHHDSTTLAADVLAWVKKRGDRPSYRIVVAGYEEYAELLSCGWTAHAWKSRGGYARSERALANRHRETLYFSPHCVGVRKQKDLIF